ncbi:Gfo/Idh/MocA family oxidoreductase [Gammaproteobacteria bacterium]|nr:Gfo/Idh/MocA family oxidoreductase [Gammaproteobacteria bacterium]
MKHSAVIVGLGNIGMLYDIHLPKKDNILTHCNAFSQHPDFELIGAVETNSELRSLFEKEYKLPSSKDIESFLADNQLSPDVYVIANSTENHLNAIEQIIAVSNPVGILCEKPIAYNVDEALEICKLCKEKKIKIFVNFIRRADPGILELKNRIDAHQIEGPFKLVAWYSKGLIHNGSHFVDLFDFLFGSINSFKIINPGPKTGKDAEPDFLLEYNSAKILFTAADADNFSFHKFELVAKNGCLTYQGNGDMTWKIAEPEKQAYGNIPLSGKDEIILGDMQKYQYNILTKLSNALNSNDDNCLCDGGAGLKNITILNKIISSI